MVAALTNAQLLKSIGELLDEKLAPVIERLEVVEKERSARRPMPPGASGIDPFAMLKARRAAAEDARQRQRLGGELARATMIAADRARRGEPGGYAGAAPSPPKSRGADDGTPVYGLRF